VVWKVKTGISVDKREVVFAATAHCMNRAVEQGWVMTESCGTNRVPFQNHRGGGDIVVVHSLETMSLSAAIRLCFLWIQADIQCPSSVVSIPSSFKFPVPSSFKFPSSVVSIQVLYSTVGRLITSLQMPIIPRVANFPFYISVKMAAICF